MNELAPETVSMLSIWQWMYIGVASGCGAYIAVLMRLLAGEKLSRLEIWATFFIGIVFSMFFSNIIGTFFNIPSGISMTMGGSAMMTGMFGMRIAKMLMKMSSKLEGVQ